MERRETLGLIGIGNIGSVFAEAFLRAGHEVVGFNRPDARAFEAMGGKPAASARAVAEAAEIVFCCLPDEAAAESIYPGADGLVAGLGPGHLVLDLASYTLPFKRRLAEEVARTGARLLDGEVSGTPDMLRNRAGSIFLAGDAEACARCLPLCRAVTAEAFVLGPFGAATKMKLINNLLSAVHTAAAAEAMALGVKAGFEPDLLARVLSSGSGSSKFLVSRAPLMAARRFDQPSGRLKLFGKYLEHIPELAADAGCATPLFDAAKRCFEEALAQGRGDEDIAVVFEVIEAMPRTGDARAAVGGQPTRSA